MDVAQQIKERYCYTCGDLVKVSTQCGLILGRASRPFRCGCVGAHSLYQQRQRNEMLAVCEHLGHKRAWDALLSETSIHSWLLSKHLPGDVSAHSRPAACGMRTFPHQSYLLY